MTYTRVTFSLTDDLIELADTQAIREGKPSRSAHIGDLIKGHERGWICGRLMRTSYTIECNSIGITVIDKGKVIFHGKDAEVTKWLDEVGV